MDGVSEYTLLNDEPNVDEGDPLGFDRLAGELVGTIQRSRKSTPLTLGIEGGWGSGKSSLMRQVAVKLGADPTVWTVWFNVWAAEGNSASEGLIKTVLHTIDTRIVRRASRKKGLLTFARASTMAVGHLIGLGKIVEVVWREVTTDARARNELPELMKEAMRGWRDKHARDGVKPLLVMLVDDLDRADPAQIFEVFEAIKLYLDTPGLVFIVGYDQNVIAEAVRAERQYIADLSGRSYLEKIVQVGYRITPPDDDGSERLVEAYTEASGTTALFDDSSRRLVIDRNQRNPRRIKRFLNTFVLMYALDPDWQQLGPKSLVDVLLLDMHFGDFMALFRAGADADPVSEFLEYYEARVKVEADLSGREAESKVAELESDIPVQYPDLFTNDEFVSLVRALKEAPRWDDMRLKLQRRRSLAVQLPMSPAADHEVAMPISAELRPGGRVMWVAFRQFGTRDSVVDGLAASLRGSGQMVDAAPPDRALRLLSSDIYDVVLVETDEGVSPPALDLLRALREDDAFTGPIAFFTPRVTTEARAQVKRFGVMLTSDPVDLEIYLRDHLQHGRFEPQATSGPPPPSFRDRLSEKLDESGGSVKGTARPSKRR